MEEDRETRTGEYPSGLEEVAPNAGFSVTEGMELDLSMAHTMNLG